MTFGQFNPDFGFNQVVYGLSTDSKESWGITCKNPEKTSCVITDSTPEQFFYYTTTNMAEQASTIINFNDIDANIVDKKLPILLTTTSE